MSSSLRLIPGLVLLLCFSLLAQAAPQAIPGPPQLAAKGFLLIDHHSGHVIAQDKSDTRMEPASLTKMLTAYVVASELKSGNIQLSDMVTVSEKAWRMPGSRMFIEVGTQVSVEQLLKGVIIQSGNDATVALAEYVAGSEEAFASLMNQYAARLGMSGSHFVNSTGLPDPDHYTTPQDMAVIASAIIRDFPEHYEWYAIKQYTYNDITQYNRNRLLWRDKHVDGVKTGHTESAGFCLVASANKDGMRLISVVLGTDSERAREQESQKLLNYGFRFFESHRLYAAGEVLKDVRIWQGTEDKIKLGLADDLYVTVPRGRYQDLNPGIRYEAIIKAPISKGAPLGNVNITLDGNDIVSRPLVALHDVERGGWWKRFVDWVKLLFHDLFN
ncbi:MAG: D-alanyl-D-alanine carboxypeptidase family protein [Granulosicoccaceae bacterium]|jgi:D-alanyl-D-alanine carboxypeptidase (penicillin-binding protein 5/6)